LYDVAVAALLLRHPGSVAAHLGLDSIGSPPMAALVALGLVMFAALGVAAARDFRRYSVIVAALICGRTTAAILLATGAIAAASPLPWPAAWNTLLAITLAAAWWPQRR
jgi:hypothetical protein